MRILDLRKATQGLKPLLAASEALAKEDLPATRYATKRAAAYVERTWVEHAYNTPLSGTLRRHRQAYVAGVRKEPLGKFNWLIFNDSGVAADEIEEGTPRRDLKQEVATWQRKRISKGGDAYAHIPFRHKVSVIKKKAPLLARRLSEMVKSRVVGSRTDATGVRRAVYQWGDRIRRDPQLNLPKQFIGMVRFEASAGKAAGSKYMTFRTVSVNSPSGSWIIQKKSGIPMVDNVADATERKVSEIIREGVDQDLGLL